MSAQQGKPSTRGPITPTSIASHLGLRWSTPGHGSGLMTWDVLLDLVVVAYWVRRPNPSVEKNRPRVVSGGTLVT